MESLTIFCMLYREFIHTEQKKYLQISKFIVSREFPGLMCKNMGLSLIFTVFRSVYQNQLMDTQASPECGPPTQALCRKVNIANTVLPWPLCDWTLR